MKGKEIIELLAKGVKVTINSDDPAYFQSYISDDLYALSKNYQLTEDQIIQLVRNAFEIAWLPEEEKKLYLAEVDALSRRKTINFYSYTGKGCTRVKQTITPNTGLE